MMRILKILLLVLPGIVWSQSELPPGEAVKVIAADVFSNNLDIVPCPMNQIRLQPYLSYQIDVLLTDLMLDVLELWQFFDDLDAIYWGRPYDALYVSQRSYDYRVHIPGLPMEIHEAYKRATPWEAVDPNTGSPLNGEWYLWLRNDGRMVALKKVNTEGVYNWQVSVVQFVIAK